MILATVGMGVVYGAIMMIFFPQVSFLKAAAILTLLMGSVFGYMIYWMETNGL